MAPVPADRQIVTARTDTVMALHRLVSINLSSLELSGQAAAPMVSTRLPHRLAMIDPAPSA
jgi:hypothetical protein